MDTMERVVSISYDSEKAIHKKWNYDANAANGTDGRIDGDNIVICDHLFEITSTSIVTIYMRAGAEHGIVTAKSDCYYVLLHGSAYFTFYDENGKEEKRTLILCDEDDAAMIPEGACFNYRAANHLGDTEMVLFRKIK